jgi:DNA-binding transcriptional ArsR family regulator
LRIIALVRTRPMTVTQVGDELGEAPAKIHYHMRELEKVGLLYLVETREKGGILEKYYQPVAREISVEKSLLSAPPGEAASVLSSVLNQVKDAFQRAARIVLEQKDGKPGVRLGISNMYITADEQEQICRQIGELFKPYEERRGIEGEREIAVTVLMYPQQAPGIRVSKEETTSTSQATWIVGAAKYDRADLLTSVMQGKRMRINVVGTCEFADDISSELVDQAIEHFHVVGKLVAPPAVREVLMKKGS